MVKFDSGYKTFDEKVDYIGTGNVCSRVQFSSYIRPYGEIINPAGKEVEKGHLLEFDLKPFKKFGDIPRPIFDLLTDKDRNESCVLYVFRIEETKPLVWILTDSKKNVIFRSFHRFTSKRYNLYRALVEKLFY